MFEGVLTSNFSTAAGSQTKPARMTDEEVARQLQVVFSSNE